MENFKRLIRKADLYTDENFFDNMPEPTEDDNAAWEAWEEWSLGLQDELVEIPGAGNEWMGSESYIVIENGSLQTLVNTVNQYMNQHPFPEGVEVYTEGIDKALKNGEWWIMIDEGNIFIMLLNFVIPESDKPTYCYFKDNTILFKDWSIEGLIENEAAFANMQTNLAGYPVNVEGSNQSFNDINDFVTHLQSIKQVHDVINDASLNVNYNDQRIEELRKEIDEALDNNDFAKLEELSKEFNQRMNLQANKIRMRMQRMGR